MLQILIAVSIKRAYTPLKLFVCESLLPRCSEPTPYSSASGCHAAYNSTLALRGLAACTCSSIVPSTCSPQQDSNKQCAFSCPCFYKVSIWFLFDFYFNILHDTHSEYTVVTLNSTICKFCLLCQWRLRIRHIYCMCNQPKNNTLVPMWW